MQIKGNEKITQLEKYCCPTNGEDGQDYLILDNECIRSLLEECRRICLMDLAIPVEEIVKMSKNIEPGETLSLEDFKVIVVYIINNDSLLFRYLDGYHVDTETMRYKFDASLVVDDVGIGDTVPAKLSFTITPNISPVVITWSNIGDTIVDHEKYDVWKKAINTWKNMSPERVTNTLILPPFNQDCDINLFLDPVENKINNTVEFDVGNDDIKFRVTIFIEYNIDTDTPIFVIQDIKLLGRFIDSNPIVSQDAVSHTLVSPVVTITNTGDFVTLNAKDFSSLKALLVLSSETIVEKLELFNNNNDTRRVNILMAK